MLVAVQLFMPGLYLPPVLTDGETLIPTAPDNHFGPCPYGRVVRSCGGCARAVCKCPSIRRGIVPTAGVQKRIVSLPPQIIISLPVQTAVCESRASGGAAVAIQVFSLQAAPSNVFGNA